MEISLKIALSAFMIISASIVASGQPVDLCAGEGAYNYRTRLKGGYRIVFETERASKYLYHQKGKRRIAEISSVSCGLLHKNLGYVGSDSEDYFVLVRSFGSGNAHDIELIRKSDGENVLAPNREACWIGASERYSIRLFSSHCVPEPDDKITLMNVGTGKMRFYNSRKNCFLNLKF